MTGKEIVKALECRVKNKCPECPYFHSYPCDRCKKMQKDALDLINTQQAEIERLEKEIEALNYIIMQPYHEEKDKCEKCEKELRTKVVKEFWSKLKTHSRKMQSSDFSGEFWDKAILVADGDNILKEMVGEQG
jgi:predicted RNase H-like nuclease (RuvC/YqgF family)